MIGVGPVTTTERERQMAKAIRFSKKDLLIIEQALAVYDADMEDNETDENGHNTNQLWEYHSKNYGDPDATVNAVRQKIYWKLQRLEKSA